jgi:hypothetical protein
MGAGQQELASVSQVRIQGILVELVEITERLGIVLHAIEGGP